MKHMYGRFAQTRELSRLISRFRFILEDIEVRARYNIAPGQWVPVLFSAPDGRRLWPMLWGLVPSWAKNPEIGRGLINARAETLAEKPAFRTPFKRRRCLIPSDGFYEWKKTGKSPGQPYFFSLPERQLFAFAGLWDEWNGSDGSIVHSFAIITTEANDLVRNVHDRMPVILAQEDEDRWLDPALQTPRDLKPLMQSFPAGAMRMQPVSTLVNSPANECPECLRESIPSGQNDLFD
ncbi:MAG TPA: SOS response-associated peptidase [Candidatus Sumerlaeota bacterium]|nr:SOS response-associated peptidase [Candidatus Sumerlaeota bacterium]